MIVIHGPNSGRRSISSGLSYEKTRDTRLVFTHGESVILYTYMPEAYYCGTVVSYCLAHSFPLFEVRSS